MQGANTGRSRRKFSRIPRRAILNFAFDKTLASGANDTIKNISPEESINQEDTTSPEESISPDYQPSSCTKTGNGPTRLQW